MNKEELKELVLKTKKQCLKRCNECNNKDDLLSLLYSYRDIVKDYKKGYQEYNIFYNNIKNVYNDFITVYVYSYFISLIKETIRQIIIQGLSLSFIKRFENYCYDKIDKLILDINNCE